MPNSILESVRAQTQTAMNPNIAAIKNMYDQFKMASNPQAAMQSLIQQNPQMANVMNIINRYGGDPKTAFFNYAKDLGVDPSSILNILK